jgi:hypothetical protein
MGSAHQLSVRRESDDLSSSRELIIPNPIGQFCENIELEWNTFLFFDIPIGIVCTCGATIFPPAITTKCVREFCAAEVVCWKPELKVGFNLLNIFMLKLPITAQVCVGDVDVLGFDVPFVEMICFDFFNPIFGPFSGIFSANSRAASNNYSACSVSVDGQTCDMCEVCTHNSGGVGMRFACEGFESAGCTLLSSEPLPTDTKMAIKVDSLVAPTIVSTNQTIGE